MRLLLRDRAIVSVELTTDHASSSGLPVLVLADGEVLEDTLLAGAQLVSATSSERDALRRAGFNLPSTGPER